MNYLPALNLLRRAVLIGALAVCGAAGALGTTGGINLIIQNDTGSDGSNIWLQWTGMGTGGLTGTTGLANSTSSVNIAPSDYGTLNAGGYQLSSFASTGTNQYTISDYTQAGGRLWFTIGDSGFTFHNAGYNPALATFTDQNFTKRYDKIEASITGSTDDNMDMTAMDGFSIPFEVIAYNSTKPSVPTQTLKGSNAAAIVSALGAVAANPSAVAPTGAPYVTSYSPYLVINSNSVNTTSSPVGSTGSFVRVIANDQMVAPLGGDPTVAANGGQIPANYLYKDYSKYIAKMDGTAATGTYSGTTTIKGLFSGVSGQTDDIQVQQTYSAQATFSSSETITTTNSLGVYTSYTGVVTIAGTTTISPTVTHSVAVKIPYQAMLAPTGIVGANAGYAYQLDGGAWSSTGLVGPLNNIFTWLAGDLLAGMNVGTIGSDKLFSGTINTHVYNNVPIGEIDSEDMFYLGQALKDQLHGSSVYDYYFSYLQNSTDFYNDYAAALYSLTDAYGFAYSDRIQGGQVAVSWDATQTNTAIDTIIIKILPDGFSSVPEPTTASLLLLTGGAWAMARRLRRRSSDAGVC